MNKKRLNEISEYLVDMSFIHRNVEHTSELSAEEKMLRELFSEYINLQHQLEEKEQEIRLDQTKKVFKVLAEAITNGSISYRTLIYDKLGFIDYADLIDGLTVTNAIFDLEEKDKVIDEAIKLANDILVSGWDYVEKDNICIKLLEILERGKNGK